MRNSHYGCMQQEEQVCMAGVSESGREGRALLQDCHRQQTRLWLFLHGGILYFRQGRS